MSVAIKCFRPYDKEALRNIMECLPPFKHTRNPAIETEDDFHDNVVSIVPLITHNGVVEKRKTTDLKLIRSQSSHNGVEFEYLPILPSVESIVKPFKRNVSATKAVEKDSSNLESEKFKSLSLSSNDAKRNIEKSTMEDREVKNKISSFANDANENLECDANEPAKSTRHHGRSCKSSKSSVKRNRDSCLKSHASSRSSSSRRSVKSASTQSSVTSTMKNVIVKRKENRTRASSTTEFRHVANGLDENDQFPHRLRH